MRLFIKALIALLLLPASAMAQTASPTMPGDWRGDIVAAPGHTLALVLHVGGTPGHWTATVDSLTQNALGLPVQTVTQEGANWRFDLASPQASFVATLSSDGRTLAGRWMQGTVSLPLTMAPTPPSAPPRRPQTPTPPFPYQSREVAYDNVAGAAHLTGTLTLPPGKGPFPAVVLITGSGQQDRDETLFGHKPFLLWADTLTRRGIAVLRVDDRQKGGSTGDLQNATSEDFAGDVAAGVAFLRKQSDIDASRIGLMGHSEGGLIAPMVAARDPAIHFIVLLAGPGEPGDALLMEQQRLIATASGLPADAIEPSARIEQRLMQAAKSAPDQASAQAALKAAWQAILREQGKPAADPPPEVMALALPWTHWFIRHDPAPVLAQVYCPVLAIDGSKDLQVNAATNLAGITTGLSANHDVTVVTLPGLNHLFQTATTGLPGEYGLIEETIAPVALLTVGDWIVKHARP